MKKSPRRWGEGREGRGATPLGALRACRSGRGASRGTAPCTRPHGAPLPGLGGCPGGGRRPGAGAARGSQGPAKRLAASSAAGPLHLRRHRRPARPPLARYVPLICASVHASSLTPTPSALTFLLPAARQIPRHGGGAAASSPGKSSGLEARPQTPWRRRWCWASCPSA